MIFAARAIVLVLLLPCPAARAQGQADGNAPSACFATPAQTCLLREAFELLQSSAPAVGSQTGLEKVVELHASAGRIADAQRVAQAIGSREKSRINALRLIAVAQARAGSLQDAGDSFDQAHQLIDARSKDPLGQAGALLAIAQAEVGAGLAANAARSLAESLELAVSLDVRLYGCSFPFPEGSLAGLLKALAERYVKDGDMGLAIRAAHAIGSHTGFRAEALRLVAEGRSASGALTEVRSLLLEANDAANASRSKRQSRNCPEQFYSGDDLVYIEQASRIAIAQAKSGFPDDATATFAAIAELVERIESAHSFSAELRRSQALSGIAAAEAAAGLVVQSAETFDRAMKAANAVTDTRFPVAALISLARALHESGRQGDTEVALVGALERALSASGDGARAAAIIVVLEARNDLALAADTGGALTEALASARSAATPGRLQLLRRIARLKQRAGASDEALALFREILEAVGAIDGEQERASALFTAIRGWPVPLEGKLVFLVEKEWIAATAQQTIQLAQSVKSSVARANILVMLAEALPD